MQDVKTERPTHYNFLVKAVGYWHAARVVLEASKEMEAPLVEQACFLLNHATELALKHWLHGKGYSEKELASRKFGHSLVQLWHHAMNTGLELHRIDNTSILQMHHVHEGHTFRYPWMGKVTYTRPTVMLPAVARLIDKVAGSPAALRQAYGPNSGWFDWPVDDVPQEAGLVEGFSIVLRVVEEAKK